MAIGDAFIIEDTASETTHSHISPADGGMAGSPLLEEGEWLGQWTSPDLTNPHLGILLMGYSDMLQDDGVDRAGSHFFWTADGFPQLIDGAGNFGYNRGNAGVDTSSRHGTALFVQGNNIDMKIREGIVINGSARVGDYIRNTGDPKGLWAVDMGDAFAGELRDHFFCRSSATETGSGRYGNSPRPIDLGTPSSLSEGSFKAIDSLTNGFTQGTTITRSAGDFTIAANSKVLCVATFQFESSETDRNSVLLRMDKDGSPFTWASAYRNSNASPMLMVNVVIPVITGGSSEIVDFSFVEQVEESTVEIDMIDCSINFYDLTPADMVLLAKTDADVSSITGTVQQVAFPTADEILVDPSFSHNGTDPERIINEAGNITVLAGFNVQCDRSATSGSTRKVPGSQLRRSGTQLQYAIASEYSRASSGSDDQFVAGYSYCAPVTLTAGQYLELDLFDLVGNSAANLIVNATDGAAIYFWAIRLDKLSGGALQDVIMRGGMVPFVR